MTFSIVARCADTGMFGVAVSSSSPAVAARCAYARAGVGAVVSQNITDPTLGDRGLDLMALGASAPEAVAVLKATGAHIEYRQVLAVDRTGRTGIHSGGNVLGTHAEAWAENVISAGNLLSGQHIPQAIVDGFLDATGHRGEEGPVHSAGMKLVDKVSWPVADLRVDWSDDCPIEALANLWDIYKPQLDAYVTRALDPTAAPSYGVPGDE